MEWHSIHVAEQVCSGYRTKTAPTDSCGTLSCLQVERNGKQRQIAAFSQNCHIEAEKIDLETISQTAIIELAADTRKMVFRYSELCGKASDAEDAVRSAIPTGFPF